MSTNTDLWAGAASPKERENRADKATGIKYLRQTLNLSEFEALAIITAQKFGLGLEVAVILGVRKLGLSQPDPLGRFSTLYEKSIIVNHQIPAGMAALRDGALDDLQVYLGVWDAWCSRRSTKDWPDCSVWASHHGVCANTLKQVFNAVFGVEPVRGINRCGGGILCPRDRPRVDQDLKRYMRPIRFDHLDRVRFIMAACFPQTIRIRDGNQFASANNLSGKRFGLSLLAIDPPGERISAVNPGKTSLHGSGDTDLKWFTDTTVPLYLDDPVAMRESLVSADRLSREVPCEIEAWRESVVREIVPTRPARLQAQALLTTTWVGLDDAAVRRLQNRGPLLMAVVVNWDARPEPGPLMHVCISDCESAGSVGVSVSANIAPEIRRGRLCRVEAVEWQPEVGSVSPQLRFVRWV